MLLGTIPKRLRDADTGGAAGAAGDAVTETPVTETPAVDREEEAFLKALNLAPEPPKESKPKAEAKPAQAAPEPKPAAEEEDEDGLTAADREHPAIKKLVKRIGKLTAKLHAKDTAPAPQATEPAKPKATAEAVAADPLAGINTLDALHEKVAQANQTLDWFEKIQERWDVDGEGDVTIGTGENQRVLTPAEVKHYHRLANRILRTQSAAQARIAEMQETNAQAKREFPFIDKEDDELTPDEAQIRAIAAKVPGILPGIEAKPDALLISHLLARALYEYHRKSAAQGAKPAANTPKKTAAAPIAPPPPLGAGAGASGIPQAAPSAGMDEEEQAAALGAEALAAYYRKQAAA
jgi:hypothetical protein